MLSRIQLFGSCLIVVTLLLFAGSAAAQDVSPRCEAAIDRAAGHYSKCLLSADASYARHENLSKLENHQARCERRFERRTNRAINRHGADECASADLVAAIADRTVTYAQGAATEAGGEAPPPQLLFTQNSTSAVLTDSTLTLTGVASRTSWFTDRPYREAGQMATDEFIEAWFLGQDSFAEDPPNADFTCTVDGDVVNYALELTSPRLEGNDLLYSVTFLGDVRPDTTTTQCTTEASLFVDNFVENLECFACIGYFGPFGAALCTGVCS